jgi:hypothetical protein
MLWAFVEATVEDAIGQLSAGIGDRLQTGTVIGIIPER